MATHRGSCLCGAVTFEVQGEFDSFYVCHCRYCQKDTGSAHAANLFASSATLNWLAGAEAVTSFTLPNTRHSKSFCRHCGSALPNQPSVSMLMVPAGCLDSPINLSPTARLFTASEPTWCKALETSPTFQGLPE
ncbi:GFA family protein [Pseudidiomarina sp. WS423]|uniref:GFA family protein n=1 Tax=Pseudidiomarina sp. WS423 TaxID=3425124 RepID=UPI003D6FD310